MCASIFKHRMCFLPFLLTCHVLLKVSYSWITNEVVFFCSGSDKQIPKLLSISRLASCCLEAHGRKQVHNITAHMRLHIRYGIYSCLWKLHMSALYIEWFLCDCVCLVLAGRMSSVTSCVFHMKCEAYYVRGRDEFFQGCLWRRHFFMLSIDLLKNGTWQLGRRDRLDTGHLWDLLGKALSLQTQYFQ